MRCVNRVDCSWSRPSEAYRILPSGGHLSSGFHQCPLSSLSFRSSFVCCSSSTSGPSDSNPESSSNRSYSRRWQNPLPRRQHPDQIPSSQIARDWIDSDTTPVSQERFTVVSYNILGDGNSSYHRELYSNVSVPYLKWGYRKRLICEELIRLNPDIISMQEVDKYFDLFSMMEKAGYAGSYKKDYKYKLCNGSGELEITSMVAQCFGRLTGLEFWRGKTLSLASLVCGIMLHSLLFLSSGSLISQERYCWVTFTCFIIQIKEM
uniref:Isoform 4 of Carbon catabolite repressor protein 4 homolog 3 n=1 Tax=Arabidopsis thaliana TaxID=3702 RepID=Q9LS39-4|nr:unknown protein [Arabidopsis thaliana]AAO30050.1 unknown protein [Arabidopsis thaliana]